MFFVIVPFHPCPAVEMLTHTWWGPLSQLIINDDVARAIGIIVEWVVDGWCGDCIYEGLRLTSTLHICFMTFSLAILF